MNEQLRTIPIIVGGSGRRAIPPEEVPRIREEIRAELERLRSLAPASELRLLVSLAEGGDALLADAAKELAIPYTAVLPFDAEEFARDFEGEALDRYRAGLEGADEIIVCPDLEEGAKRHEQSVRGAGRDYYYRQATLYVARMSHVLFAIWDGEPGGKGGCGTAEAADEALSRADGAVYRVNVNGPTAEADRRPGNWVAFNETVRKTDAFNRAAASYGGPRYELGPADGDTKPADADRPRDRVLARLSSAYASADGLSVENAKKFRRTLFWMAVLATLVTVAFLLYDEMELHWMILAMAVMLLLLFAIDRAAGKLGSHEKYVEYRVLAERLRVQFFLRKAGLSRSVNDCIPWAQSGEYPWIERAVAALTVGGAPEGRASVRKEWLEAQRAYHEQAGRKTAKQLKSNDATQRTALILTILAFAAALVFEIVWGGLFTGVPKMETAALERVRTIVKIVVGGLSAATLFASNYYGKLSLPRVTADHERMERFYRETLAIAERDGESEKLLIRLAREELIENGNWTSYVQDNAPDVSIS